MTGQPIVNASQTAGDPAALAGPAAHESKFLPAIAGYAFSTAGGDFELEIGPNASRLLVARQGYANAVLPLSILPGQRLTGLVVELQPRPSETPSQ